MRFAYGDPPYIGQAKKHYKDHPDYAGEVDHAELIERMERDYDGWALSCTMKSLPILMRMVPEDVLTLAWCKPNTAPPMGDHRHYSWEPVILRPVRRPGPGYAWTHLVCNVEQYTFRDKPEGYVVGAKPYGFCGWLFENAGLTADDELIDLFPGSGAVTAAWARWKANPPLFAKEST
jgi:hypothetical protein